MKKFNIIIGIILLIASIMTALALYFNILPNTTLIITGIIAAIVVLISTLQCFHHKEWHEYNPRAFWIVWSCICGLIAVVPFYLCGFGVLDQRCAGVIFIGGGFSAVPILGVFLAEFGQLIQELRYSIT